MGWGSLSGGAADASFTLEFPRRAMDDVLKSLTVLPATATVSAIGSKSRRSTPTVPENSSFQPSPKCFGYYMAVIPKLPIAMVAGRENEVFHETRNTTTTNRNCTWLGQPRLASSQRMRSDSTESAHRRDEEPDPEVFGTDYVNKGTEVPRGNCRWVDPAFR
jgi:hypothetical protein